MLLDSRKKRALLFSLSVITAGFLLLTAFVLFFPKSVIDLEFSEEVQEHSSHLLDATMKAISWFGYMPNSPVVVVLTAFLFFVFKHKREALFILLTLLSGFVSTIVKVLVNRPRPEAALFRVVEKTSQQSFPSGHVLFYVIFFGFLVLLMYRLTAIPKYLRTLIAIFSLLLIFTIPFSRIYLGAHWFSDVLGGFLLGINCLCVLSFLYLKNQNAKYK